MPKRLISAITLTYNLNQKSKHKPRIYFIFCYKHLYFTLSKRRGEGFCPSLATEYEVELVES